GVQGRLDPGEQGVLRQGCFVPAFGVLGNACTLLLHSLEVGQDQLGVDDLDVAYGIDVPGNVENVGLLEATDDLHNGIDLPDVAQELVAQAFARAGAFDQAGDVDELDRRRDDDAGLCDSLKR